MNRKIFLYSMIGLALFLLPHKSNAAELITNGSFETGMTGWTINNATNPWYVWQSVPTGFDNGFNAPAQAQVGSRVAYQGVTGDPGTRFITQDFAIPSGSTASIIWRHRFQFDNASFCNGTTQCGTVLYTVDILNTSNLLLANLYNSSVASEQIVDTGWQINQRNISAFAGLTIRLRFRTTNTANLSGPGQLEIDGVSVQSPGIPTAANVSLSGRVSTNEGVGISRIIVRITDSAGNVRTATTNSFGAYRFEELPAGDTYTLEVNSKKYLFANSPRIINVQENVANIDFVASP